MVGPCLHWLCLQKGLGYPGPFLHRRRLDPIPLGWMILFPIPIVIYLRPVMPLRREVVGWLPSRWWLGLRRSLSWYLYRLGNCEKSRKSLKVLVNTLWDRGVRSLILYHPARDSHDPYLDSPEDKSDSEHSLTWIFLKISQTASTSVEDCLRHFHYHGWSGYN